MENVFEPYLLSINISAGGIPKLSVFSAPVAIDGLEGDGHNHEKHRTPLQALSLQDMEKLVDLSEEGFSLKAGETGENLTCRNLNVNALPIGTILKFSGGVVLELTKVRKPCYVLDSIDPKLKEIIIGRCGIYARVIQAGTLSVGETIEALKPALFSVD